ncbi:MT-A70 family methyltransferase [Devosia sp. XGJD_8]|uniref:MT-A70 family methyltransferase n=1 Tax=Devosia sp. XGJD_8 TaxID=3391187 RepID=UPI0039855805
MNDLALFSVAKEALAELRRVDEVQDVRDKAERMKLYGRQVKDRSIIADATEVILRAERRLGELLIEGRAAGQIGTGRPSKSNLDEPEENGATEAPFQRVTLEEIGISKKLSSRAQKLASVAGSIFEEGVEAARIQVLGGGAWAINPLKTATTAEKKAKRAEREAELGAKQIALPVAKFGVILTDDEWDYETWSENGMDRSAANHYPTSSLEKLKERDVLSLAADDSVLFMWTTQPHLAQGIELMAHRGFEYKTGCIWKKVYPGNGHGMGRWFWINHEILLVGTRGNVPAPAPGTQWPSIIEAPVGEHSAKPAIFHELIESYFPTLPKIELNARTARPGWVRWGYEAPPDEAAAPAPDFAAIAEARAYYEAAIATLAEGKGHLTMATAEPILRAGRAAGVSPMILADDIGHPLGTIKTWLNRLGLTSMAHMQQLNDQRAAAAAERRDGK